MTTKDTTVPEVGKIYHVFDDGKIKLTRHYLVKCKEVIPFKELSTDPKYKDVFESWQDAVKEIDWVFNTTTDYVVLCETYDEETDSVVHDDEPLYYARTRQWGWFGFGTFLDDGILDVDRSVWQEFYKDAHDPKISGYSAESLKEIETLNKF